MPFSSYSDLRMVAVAVNADSSTGFAICNTLIHRLAGLNAPSAFPWVPDTADPEDIHSIQPYPQLDALTLILACRNRTDDALRTRLLDSIDKSMQARNVGKYSFAAMFREKLVIEIDAVDVTSDESVRRFSSAVKNRHQYMSHLIFCENPSGQLEPVEKDPTGLRKLFFPSFLLCKLLEPTLCAYRAPPSRIIWAPNVRSDATSRALFHAVITRLDQEGPSPSTLMQLDSAPRENAGGHEIPRIKHMIVSHESQSSPRRPSGCASQVQRMLCQATNMLYRYTLSHEREYPTAWDSQTLLAGVVDAALTPSILLSSDPAHEPKVPTKGASKALARDEEVEKLLRKFKEMLESA